MQRTHSEPKEEQEPQAFSDTFSSQQLAVEGTRQLRQDNVKVRENLQEISDRNHQINDLKIEQAVAIDALKEVRTGQARLAGFEQQLGKRVKRLVSPGYRSVTDYN
ncbi:uncharacterized protein FFE2_08596 [Fusarium fujikuroi]|nr:uncharacterized protein FFE2_08596 [Fusarium fujikuroi]